MNYACMFFRIFMYYKFSFGVCYFAVIDLYNWEASERAVNHLKKSYSTLVNDQHLPHHMLWTSCIFWIHRWFWVPGASFLSLSAIVSSPRGKLGGHKSSRTGHPGGRNRTWVDFGTPGWERSNTLQQHWYFFCSLQCVVSPGKLMRFMLLAKSFVYFKTNIGMRCVGLNSWAGNLNSWSQQINSTDNLNKRFQQMISTADLNRWSRQLISTDELNR